VSALLGTDQISGADERSSILVQSSDDRLTEVRSKPVAIITAVDNQDEIYNIFTFNRRYNPNNTVHRCQPSRHWNQSTIPLLVKNGRHQAGEGFRAHVTLLSQLVQLMTELQPLMPTQNQKPAYYLEPGTIAPLSKVEHLTSQKTGKFRTEENEAYSYMVCTSVARPERPM
jgi:hypothetical protein